MEEEEEEEEWGLQTSQTLSHSGWIFTIECFMAAEAEKRDSIWKKGKLVGRGRSPKQAVAHDSASLASGMKAISKKYYPVLVQIDAIATFYARYRK